jgi:hypothetical protein
MTHRLIALTEESRALKIQELISKAIAGELRWYQVAEIAGISDRHMRRLKIQYEEYKPHDAFNTHYPLAGQSTPFSSFGCDVVTHGGHGVSILFVGHVR